MQRMVGRAEAVLPFLPPRSFDLVFTSPPAYPSPRQNPGSLGTEPDFGSYVDALGRIIFMSRRVLKRGGFLVLVVEPIVGADIMQPLSARLKRSMLVLLATYRWNHGGGGSWVIILGKGPDARLNRMAPSWNSLEWLIPRPGPDISYGFYEWPQGLVEAVTQLTIPNGGRILDPFAGKAIALANLDPPFEVVAVDVMSFDDESSSANQDAISLENKIRWRSGYPPEEIE